METLLERLLTVYVANLELAVRGISPDAPAPQSHQQARLTVTA